MKINFTPWANVVVVEMPTGEKKLASGLVIIDTKSQEPWQAKVVAAGPKCTDVKVGDVLLFDYETGLEETFNGKPHRMMAENHALGIVEGE